MRIGTRRSPLAIAQAEEVGAHLSAHGMEVELVPMTTSGDEGAAVALANDAHQSREPDAGVLRGVGPHGEADSMDTHATLAGLG